MSDSRPKKKSASSSQKANRPLYGHRGISQAVRSVGITFAGEGFCCSDPGEPGITALFSFYSRIDLLLIPLSSANRL